MTNEAIAQAEAMWPRQKLSVESLSPEFGRQISYFRLEMPNKVSEEATKQNVGKVVSVKLDQPCEWCELELRVAFDEANNPHWAYYYLWNNRLNVVYERKLFMRPSHKGKGLLEI